jgi:hypothetical protein
MIRNNRIVIDVHDIEEKKTDLPRVTDKLYHIMLYTSFWVGFELTMLMVIGTDCTVVVNLTTIRPRRSPIIEMELGFSMIWLKYWPSGVKRQSLSHMFHCIYLCIEYLKLVMLNLNTHTLNTKKVHSKRKWEIIPQQTRFMKCSTQMIRQRLWNLYNKKT